MIVMNGSGGIIEVPTTPENCVGAMQFEDTFPPRLASYGITPEEYKESIGEFNVPIKAPHVVRVVCWVSALSIVAGLGACIGGAVTSAQNATAGMAPGIKAGFILFACGMAVQILFRCAWAQSAMPKLTEAIRLANEKYSSRNVSFKWLRQQAISHSGRRTTTRTLVIELGSPTQQPDVVYTVALPPAPMMQHHNGIPMMHGDGMNGMMSPPGAIPDSAPPAYNIAIDDAAASPIPPSSAPAPAAAASAAAATPQSAPPPVASSVPPVLSPPPVSSSSSAPSNNNYSNRREGGNMYSSTIPPLLPPPPPGPSSSSHEPIIRKANNYYQILQIL